MNIFKQTLTGVLLLAVLLIAPFFSATTISAQRSPLCSIFPFLEGIQLFGGICVINNQGVENNVNQLATDAGSLVSFGLSLIFVGIIAVAVYVIIRAAIKYIRSEGDEGKVEEAQKAIKTVFMGVGALLVGIVGLVIILVFFQSSGALQGPQGGTNVTPVDNFLNGLGGSNTGGTTNPNVTPNTTGPTPF